MPDSTDVGRRPRNAIMRETSSTIITGTPTYNRLVTSPPLYSYASISGLLGDSDYLARVGAPIDTS
jgi:hypothetical protein